MRTNYKLLFLVACLLLVYFTTDTTKAMEISNVENQASTYSVKGVSWYLVAGQKNYTASFYMAAGSTIQISVAPSVSGAKYSVGIYQPSGSERKVTKTGTTTTTYAISSSGYYKVFLHNTTSTAVDYGMSYAY